MWAMRSFINPGIMFPAVRNATALGRGSESYSFISRCPNIHFRGRQCSPAQFPILWQKLSSNAFAIFFSFFFPCHPSPRRASDEGRAQLVSQRARVRPVSTYDTRACLCVCTCVRPMESDGLDRPFGFIYARTCRIRQRRTLSKPLSLPAAEKKFLESFFSPRTASEFFRGSRNVHYTSDA